MSPEQKLPSLDGVKVVALVSVGAHPTSGRARRAEQDARAVELGLRLVGDKLRVLHAGDLDGVDIDELDDSAPDDDDDDASDDDDSDDDDSDASEDDDSDRDDVDADDSDDPSDGRG